MSVSGEEESPYPVTPVWRLPDAQRLMPQCRDWLMVRRYLDERDNGPRTPTARVAHSPIGQADSPAGGERRAVHLDTAW